MKTVIVASENPVKIAVARQAFAAVFPNEQFEFLEIKSKSGVAEQPMEEETKRGAENRLHFIMKHRPEADYWVSQEGGLCRDGDRMFERAWILITDKSGFVSDSSTAQFFLPKEMQKYIENGMELGHAADKLFNGKNSKQGIGAIGYLTDGIIDRTEYYLPAAIIALSALKHREWY